MLRRLPLTFEVNNNGMISAVGIRRAIFHNVDESRQQSVLHGTWTCYQLSTSNGEKFKLNINTYNFNKDIVIIACTPVSIEGPYYLQRINKNAYRFQFSEPIVGNSKPEGIFAKCSAVFFVINSQYLISFSYSSELQSICLFKKISEKCLLE